MGNKTLSINVATVRGIEDILEFLKENYIYAHLTDFDKYGFSRTIKFQVYDIIYKIIWYSNQSELHIGDNTRTPFLPFKYMFLDKSFPMSNIIGFSYIKYEKKSIFDREYPYEVFRIPF